MTDMAEHISGPFCPYCEQGFESIGPDSSYEHNWAECASITCDRLKTVNAELVEALEAILQPRFVAPGQWLGGTEEAYDKARAALGKAKDAAA